MTHPTFPHIMPNTGLVTADFHRYLNKGHRCCRTLLDPACSAGASNAAPLRVRCRARGRSEHTPANVVHADLRGEPEAPLEGPPAVVVLHSVRIEHLYLSIVPHYVQLHMYFSVGCQLRSGPLHQGKSFEEGLCSMAVYSQVRTAASHCYLEGMFTSSFRSLSG